MCPETLQRHLRGIDLRNVAIRTLGKTVPFTMRRTFYAIPLFEGENIFESSGKGRVNNTPNVIHLAYLRHVAFHFLNASATTENATDSKGYV